MELVTCSKCKIPQPPTEFHRDKYTTSGLKSNCKECSRAASRAWARANKERNAEKARKWREANPERVYEQTRQWHRANPKIIAESVKNYRRKNPEKYRAHNLLQKAVQRGKIIKPRRCEDCGKLCEPHELDGHHEDYNKPLVVKWLCRLCHVRQHKKQDGLQPKPETVSSTQGL